MVEVANGLHRYVLRRALVEKSYAAGLPCQAYEQARAGQMTFTQTWMSVKLIRRVGWHHVPTVTHWCPACNSVHDFACEKPFTNGAKWTFDGNVLAPTFNPSMNIKVGPYGACDEKPEGTIDVCHYFLKEGVIDYLGDCTHAMRSTKVPLPDLPIEVVGKYTLIEGRPVG